MALVEVARFLDLTEAQSAAAALRASGIPVFMQNENWGQTEAYLQLAMGGFRLWTPEEEAASAKAFIAACRAEPSDRAPEVRDGPVTMGLSLLSLLLGPGGVYMAAALRRWHRLAKDA
jgi:hypothetical protein